MRVIQLILLVIIVLSCKNKEVREPDSDFNQEKLVFKIDSLYQKYYKENGPGAAILITFKGQKIVNKGYGLRNLETKQPITSSTNMRSGSLAKQFTALGLLKLQEQGKLSLKDTAYRYLQIPSLKDITIEQLISHTSGLEDAEYVFEKEWDSSHYVNNQDIIQWYSNNSLYQFRPGARFEYNNGAYYILAGIIEAVSGMPFRAFMKGEVFEAIGMSRTSFIDMENPELIEEKALCYEKDSLGDWQAMEGQHLDNLLGAGGIYTNLNDYFTYLSALRNGEIWDKESLEFIFKPISMNIELHSEDMSFLKGKESSYTLGWEVTDSLAVSAGSYSGVNNWVIFERKRPLNIVIFTNNDILFKEKLVDKTYQLVDAHFAKCCSQFP